jgi:hypothetical protein
MDHTSGSSDMNITQHHRLTSANRVLIFTLTLGGMLMDDIRLADLPCSVALFMWLWLPLCIRLEARLLRWLGENRISNSASRNTGSTPGLPFTN